MEDLLLTSKISVSTVIVFLNALGYLFRFHTNKLNNKYIPWVMAVIGVIVGLLSFRTIDGAVEGMVMGLASVGIHGLRSGIVFENTTKEIVAEKPKEEIRTTKVIDYQN